MQKRRRSIDIATETPRVRTMPDSGMRALEAMIDTIGPFGFVPADADLDDDVFAIPVTPRVLVTAQTSLGKESLLKLRRTVVLATNSADAGASLRAENQMLNGQVAALLDVLTGGRGDETEIPSMFGFLPEGSRFAILRDGQQLYNRGIDEASIEVEAQRMVDRIEHRCSIGTGQRFVHRCSPYIAIVDIDRRLDDVRCQLVRLTLCQIASHRKERLHHDLIERLRNMLGRDESAGDESGTVGSDRNALVEADVGRLVEATLRDSLTRIYNRAKVIDSIAELKRAGTSYCLVMADIDRFKTVNDEFGHLAGDRVIVDVASCLENERRVDDVVARWGGEEFVAVLPNTDVKAGLALAERWREAIASDVAVGGRQVTCSFGVAPSRRGVEPSTILEEADAALYRAKRAGRNRAVLAEAARPVSITGEADATVLARAGLSKP